MIYDISTTISHHLGCLLYTAKKTTKQEKNCLQGILYTTIYINATLPFWLDMGLGWEVIHDINPHKLIFKVKNSCFCLNKSFLLLIFVGESLK